MNDLQIQISLADQRLWLLSPTAVFGHWSVSTARNGAGEEEGSGCTPRGWHRVRARIGAGCAPGTVFVGRRPTGEVYTEALGAAHPERDWILTRILWLTGLEPGRNRLGRMDTLRRYIYIHGCPDHCPMGVSESHGCIRMRNDEVMELFERVPAGTAVWIQEETLHNPRWRELPTL